MTPLRLHGTCPECGLTERLRPNGTMTQHARPRRGLEYSAPHCDGAGREPVAGSVAAWLDAQDAMARAGVDRAERAVTEATAARERAIEHMHTVTKATAKARARLARKGTE